MEQTLLNYPWIGNIRELRNVAERFMVLYNKDFDADTILKTSLNPAGSHEIKRSDSLPDPSLEMEEIRNALNKYRTRLEAAKSLGISRATLWRKMRELGLS